MIHVDHIGIAARDPLASARALAEILGASEPAVDGPDDDMYRIDLDGAFVLFNATDRVPPVHVAFRVDQARFAAVIDRLHAGQIPLRQ